jgi:hypothetical protein
VAKLSNAGSLVDPRNTAVLEEKKSGTLYAIDPALVDFGVPPPVIPLATWMGEWPPSMAENDAPAASGDHERSPAKRKTAALTPTPPPAAAGASR